MCLIQIAFHVFPLLDNASWIIGLMFRGIYGGEIGTIFNFGKLITIFYTMTRIFWFLLRTPTDNNCHDLKFHPLVLNLEAYLLQEPAQFNNFLGYLNKYCKEQDLHDFSELLGSKGMTLITKTEAPDRLISNLPANLHFFLICRFTRLFLGSSAKFTLAHFSSTILLFS